MNTHPALPRLARIGAASAIALLGSVALANAATAKAPPTGPRLEISFPASAHAKPITGRVYVAISRSNAKPPIEQTDPTGVPLFGHDVKALKPGTQVAITHADFGTPVHQLSKLPAGDYWMQPFVNIYTRFKRADGHTVWLHMDHWEGQDWKRSPGNLYGTPVKVHYDPNASTPIKLVADHVIGPIKLPADTRYVKRFRIKSAMLSHWWGHPIYFGATVLLPRGYASHPHVRYPVIYDEGHFSLHAPMGFDRKGSAFRKYWLADGTPRYIVVTLQHPSPYYDDSYAVNSANDGPWGDAIQQELLPAIDQRFRTINQPWARILTGGSTGGWISVALQVFHPDYYGGSFASCPDSLDFRYHQIVNIYADKNAYYKQHGWVRVERPDTRKPDGNITSMMKDENWYELAVGDHSRSGGQWDIWEATFGPVGADGYPQRIWNKRTGVINHQVAAYWKQHYDLRHILQTQWSTLGPKVTDKLHIYVGDADTYYLNMGVRMMDGFLKTAKSPSFHGSVTYQPMAPHCWGPRGDALIHTITQYVDSHAPPDANLKDWRY
ncbi:alpha/beta hydrolase-fold protein [Oleiagrimonas sp. C23AA]|uniref:alpha/beta hydrolase-fold protein n=1 Tax=Oleiagrimonas sp. C23AA TaxID=2719047 RepID=UPI001423200A|nr:alpha/beta hydrolase-fold protein [Oleiagrimonas sp. C23AA]NII11943.1 esterase family protein [Oleiagrimonas sp. C23AA]